MSQELQIVVADSSDGRVAWLISRIISVRVSV